MTSTNEEIVIAAPAITKTETAVAPSSEQATADD